MIESFDNINIDWSDRKILIAEDDETSCLLLDEFFECTKAKVLLSRCGQSAINSFYINHDVDMVILDLRLPVMDGFDVVKEIKRVNEQVPVIAQSAIATDDMRQKCFRYGFDEFISKPFTCEQIFQILVKYLGY